MVVTLVIPSNCPAQTLKHVYQSPRPLVKMQILIPLAGMGLRSASPRRLLEMQGPNLE